MGVGDMGRGMFRSGDGSVRPANEVGEKSDAAVAAAATLRNNRYYQRIFQGINANIPQKGTKDIYAPGG